MGLRNLKEWISRTQLWRSIFRHGPPDTPRNRALIVVSNFFLHLHPVTIPRHALKVSYTWGMGGIAFLLFMILSLTGVLLMFYYVPDVDRAYSDMKDLRYAVPFGLFLRNVHRWSAHAMVLVGILHMMRVFYTGAYRPPREFNWCLGVILLVLTLVLSFTGYLLPWDQLAYWAITVGTNMAASAPFIGHQGPFHELLGMRVDNDLRYVLLGGTVVGQNALTRFYVLHCVALPCIMSVLLAIHFWRIRKDGGISRPGEMSTDRPSLSPKVTQTIASSADEPPSQKGPERRYRLLAYVKGETFSGKRNLDENEVQVWPHLVVREFLTGLTVIVLIWLVSIWFNAPLEGVANPSVTPNPAKAPWYFVGLQELLVYFDPWIAGAMLPGLIVFGLLAIPYLDTGKAGIGEYAFENRKFAVTVFTLGAVFWFSLILIGLFFRGPAWAWYWPWENWMIHKETVAVTRNLPAFWGGLLLLGYFAIGLIWPSIQFRRFRKDLGWPRYIVTMLLLLLMIGVPLKIILRLAFNIKYVLTTSWFNI